MNKIIFDLNTPQGKVFEALAATYGMTIGTEEQEATISCGIPPTEITLDTPEKFMIYRQHALCRLQNVSKELRKTRDYINRWQDNEAIAGLDTCIERIEGNTELLMFTSRRALRNLIDKQQRGECPE